MIPDDNKLSVHEMYRRGIEHSLEGRRGPARDLFETGLAEAIKQSDLHYENILRNELEIMDGATRLSSLPRAVNVMLTTRCNMECPFCYARHMQTSDLSAKTCREIMELFPYLQKMIWQGGEASLHPQFAEMIEESSRYRNINQTIITNGLFLSERWIDLFARTASFEFVIPVESVTRGGYEHYRPGSSLDTLVNNIRCVNDYRVKHGARLFLNMNVILMKSNHRELPAIVDFAIENAFSSMIITDLYQCDEKFYRDEYFSPSEEDGYMNEIMPPIRAKLDQHHIYLQDRFSRVEICDSGLKNIAKNEHVRPKKSMRKDFICYAPWQQLFVVADGCVRNYCYCTNSVGDLKNETLKEIWNNENSRIMRKMALEKDRSGCHQLCVSGKIEWHNLRII